MKIKISYSANDPNKGMFVSIDPYGKGCLSIMRSYGLDENGLGELKKELDEIRGSGVTYNPRNKEIEFDRTVGEKTRKIILDAVYPANK